MVENLRRDIRTALRSLRAAPAFTAVVIGVLTLATGAATAVFSVTDVVALRRLPFDQADRLVALDSRTPNGEVVRSPFTAPAFLALRERRDLFSGLAAVSSSSVTLAGEGDREPEVLSAQRVSAEFFGVLRVFPSLGSAFTANNEIEGRDKVAVISHRLWQRRFASAPNVVGQRLPAAEGSIEIIGVMPASFAYPVGAVQPTEVWIPYVIPADERTANIAAYLRMVGRLQNGLSIAAAQQRLDATGPEGRPVGLSSSQWNPVIRDLRASSTGDVRTWLLMLLASAICLVLIACVNVANLSLVRATVRQRELSVRAALGATRWDVARMLLTENVLLAVAGTACGVFVAWIGTEALRSVLPPSLPRLADIAIDWRVLSVSAGAAVMTGIGFGLAPALRPPDAKASLAEHQRTATSSLRHSFLRGTFVVAEVALAVVLGVGAGLFLASFARVMRVDLGVDYQNVLLVDVRPKGTDAGARQANGARVASLIDRLRATDGIDAVSMASSNVPFTGRLSSGPITIPGRTENMLPGNHTISVVAGDYFRSLGVSMVAGRFFTDADSDGGSVVIINQAVARAYFPNASALGQTVSASGDRTIIGIVGNVRTQGPEQDTPYEFFVPGARGKVTGGTLIVKTSSRATAIVPRVRAAIRSEFPDLAIPTVRTLEDRFDAYISERRLSMLLLTLFGLLGLTIAAVGIYGVVTYAVSQRTRDIGIRMALGAQRSTIVMSVLRVASVQAAIGLVAGLGLAWILATTVKTMLFEIEPREVWIYVVVGGVLGTVALLAALLPARRATKIDPIVALRSE
jgi:predicted permease